VHTHGNGNYTVVKFDKNVIISNFEQELFFCFCKVLYGFYNTEDNLPNGATVPAIK
jgi:deoxyribose-phosphate aldolase